MTKVVNAFQKQGLFKPSQFAPLCTEKCLPSYDPEGGISAEKALWLTDCRVSATEALKP